jgi:hypothetical protein
LANVDTGNGSVGLTPGTTHSSLQSIGTGARQHLVDSDNVVWVGPDAEMETLLSGNFDQVPRVGDVSLCIYNHLKSLVRLSYLNVLPDRQYKIPRMTTLLGELTCWRKYGRLQEPLSSIVHTRWKPSGYTGGTRRRSHAFGPGRRCGSWDQGHRG